ncbi:hypothetical protein H310_03102 [Aphanomyces invadans]|uniref:Uncharacterized protein n=1 Tax=Aphanomyces invadans TaxID=157072 RepID=A0A024UL37_9STRA|nr:hypothetical protein H310_03102 [Aphanomyces invadans]ETW07004.1 hypothetical protein H310_03102 [Aphanomyces invadans]|eukprot:XP_008865079.1 hypothetical protein H310_03102 [Aphanomyces invadans]
MKRVVGSASSVNSDRACGRLIRLRKRSHPQRVHVHWVCTAQGFEGASWSFQSMATCMASTPPTTLRRAQAKGTSSLSYSSYSPGAMWTQPPDGLIVQFLAPGATRTRLRFYLRHHQVDTMRGLFVVAAVATAQASGETSLKRCDTGKIALTSVPYMATPAAEACGAEALGGKSIRSIFETSVTPPDTIAKMVHTPSCQTWWNELSAPFARFKPCMYLGMSIQSFSNLSLEAFLEANNQEIQRFDPNRPADNSPIETDDDDAPTDSPAEEPPTTAVPVITTMAPTTTTVAPLTTASTPIVMSPSASSFQLATWCSVAAAVVAAVL